MALSRVVNMLGVSYTISPLVVSPAITCERHLLMPDRSIDVLVYLMTLCACVAGRGGDVSDLKA